MGKIETKERIGVLKSECERLNIHLTEFAPNSFRLQKTLRPTIDIYPKRMRVFNHFDMEWGDISDLKKFITFQFKD